MSEQIKSGDSVTFTLSGGIPVDVTSGFGPMVSVSLSGGKKVTQSIGGQSITVLNPNVLPDYVKRELDRKKL
jgi:hypothetical protein